MVGHPACGHVLQSILVCVCVWGEREHCISYMLGAITKCLTRSDLPEERFVWAHSFQDTVHNGGEGPVTGV